MLKQNELRETFDYREGWLFYKNTGQGRTLSRPAGGRNGKYWYIYAGGAMGTAQRAIWVWHNGDIPAGLYVDHIDHNQINNRIENLRLVTTTENGRNRRVPQNSRSGAHGVYQYGDKWRASIWIGTFDTLEEAVAARRKAEAQFGYHPNHGQVVN